MSPRYFAVVPAAGHSTRMGEPKLLLPLEGQPLIAHTLAAWRRSRVSRIFVVVRDDDVELASFVRASPAALVIPVIPPPDMKASIQAALRHIEQTWLTSDADAFLVAPADMPRLAAPIVDRLIALHQRDGCGSILLPTLEGKTGHPALFPWPLARAVHALGENEGIDALIRRCPSRLVECDDLISPPARPFADIDTPADYDRLK